MSLRDHFDRERIRQPEQRFEAPAGAPGGGLEQVRQQADELLAAADEAIRKALSGDSQQFLRAIRQHGGE